MENTLAGRTLITHYCFKASRCLGDRAIFSPPRTLKDYLVPWRKPSETAGPGWEGCFSLPSFSLPLEQEG
jgi:hypothetical protein